MYTDTYHGLEQLSEIIVGSLTGALLCYKYLQSFRPAAGVPSDDISAAASSKYGVLVDVLPLVVSDGWY